MSEVLYSLRKLDFPECAREALSRLAGGFAQDSSAIPGLGGTSEELAQQIIQEFVFPPLGRGKQAKKLSATQELQISEILVNFYHQEKEEYVRHSIFRSLFNNGSEDYRQGILCKMLSLAVGVQCGNVLDSAAIWMQIQGCFTEIVHAVIKTLVDDYINLIPSGESPLSNLPKLSSHFACNFITGITAVYHPPSHRPAKSFIPIRLLEIVAQWIEDDPQLCLVSLFQTQNAFLQPQKTTLWTSPTKPNTHTPIPSLVRWYTKAPILEAIMAKTKDSRGAAAAHNAAVSEPRMAQYARLFSQIHLSTLTSILAFQTMPGATQLELITLADMNRIVKDAAGLVKLAPSPDENASVQVAMDRLLQTLQVSLATGGFRCSLADLRNICQCLPPSKLLSILQSQHLSQAPPPMHNAS